MDIDNPDDAWVPADMNLLTVIMQGRNDNGISHCFRARWNDTAKNWVIELKEEEKRIQDRDEYLENNFTAYTNSKRECLTSELSCQGDGQTIIYCLPNNK